MTHTLEQELELLAAEPGSSWLEATQSGQAFLSSLPAFMRNLVLAIPGEILDMDEDDLREKGRCRSTEYALRMAFWQEYERTLQSSVQNTLSLSRMLRDLMTIADFRRVIGNQYRLAWVLKPVRGYLQDLTYMLVRGREQLWAIVNMPVYNEKGRPDSRTAKVVLDAVKQIEDRVMGQTIQKQQQLQVKVNAGQQVTPEMLAQAEGAKELDQKIKMLELELKTGSSPTADFDLTVAETQTHSGLVRRIV